MQITFSNLFVNRHRRTERSLVHGSPSINQNPCIEFLSCHTFPSSSRFLGFFVRWCKSKSIRGIYNGTQNYPWRLKIPPRSVDPLCGN